MKDDYPIVINQITANRLAKLYNELSIIPSKQFDQDDCHCCVIGHGIRTGVMNGFRNTDDDFAPAISWMGFRKQMPFPVWAWVEEYLFGTLHEVGERAKLLGLPDTHYRNTPAAARTRIKAVLDRAGYDLV